MAMDVRLDERLAALRHAGKRAAAESRYEQGLETPATDDAVLRRLAEVLDSASAELTARTKT